MDKKIAAAVLFLMIVLTGCKTFGPTDKTKGELVTGVDVHKGFSGLEMEFIKGQPSSYVWGGAEFPITLKLQNKGASDIANGELVIIGNLYFAKSEFIQFSLAGKSEFNPEGEFSFEKFSATAAKVNEDKTESFFVLACYQYKTYASAPICINLRIEDLEEIPKGECSVGSISLSSGQGAPVAVTKVEEEIIPTSEEESRLNLKIYISNKGSGKVVDYESYSKDCRGIALSDDDIGKITVSDMRLSNYRLGGGEEPIKCINLDGNSFKLDANGQFIMECYVNLDRTLIGSTAFTTPLTIELLYGQSQLSESKTITIKSSPTDK